MEDVAAESDKEMPDTGETQSSDDDDEGNSASARQSHCGNLTAVIMVPD
jgi:hypothetical protein